MAPASRACNDVRASKRAHASACAGNASRKVLSRQPPTRGGRRRGGGQRGQHVWRAVPASQVHRTFQHVNQTLVCILVLVSFPACMWISSWLLLCVDSGKIRDTTVIMPEYLDLVCDSGLSLTFWHKEWML